MPAKQTIENRYVDVEKLKAFLKGRFPGQTFEVKLRRGRFFVETPEILTLLRLNRYKIYGPSDDDNVKTLTESWSLGGVQLH
ncbi:hypothetical protein BofuT4_uP159910.1 [Botrytis cinerea T4]|uniref:Uncharacterized protein n=1 Tax=Botryotinia fuckeliana (strain T4) TaxID=999810 RepID=G2YU72_BOTF4|nr:hypothetical protein BofuT4_uP159910.1 [Botrytis cinerea T4]